jgi:ABC-type sulfate transport system substrate-binding protein
VNKAVAPKSTKTFAARPGQFTIEQLGGWDKAQKRFFDPRNGVMARIERQVGWVTG